MSQTLPNRGMEKSNQGPQGPQDPVAQSVTRPTTTTSPPQLSEIRPETAQTTQEERVKQPARRDYAGQNIQHLVEEVNYFKAECERIRSEKTYETELLRREIAEGKSIAASLQNELKAVNTENTKLREDNVALLENCRHLSAALHSERFHRGCISIIAPILAALGGGLTTVWTDWKQGLSIFALAIGCALMLYNGVMSFLYEAEQRGVLPFLRRLWYGPSKVLNHTSDTFPSESRRPAG